MQVFDSPFHASPGAAPAPPAASSDATDPYDTVDAVVPAEPPRVGSYRILHPIASGSMGDVFCAFNEATGEKVALKLVRRCDPTRSHEKDRNFFLREMSILSRLNHSRIIRVRDFGSIDGQLFMAMEYVKTIDLRRELVQCPAKQQIRLVCGIGCYILEALDHAHGQSIVHRDIKPANVLVYRNARQDHKIGIKLADFGISKDVRQAGLSGITHEGEMRGTIAFMSPEQLRNSRDATTACDLYSTAAVLYFYLTGMHPHQESQLTPTPLSRVIEGEPISISRRRSDLPAGLCEVIDRGLAPADQGRFASASEFHQALIAYTRKEGA